MTKFLLAHKEKRISRPLLFFFTFIITLTFCLFVTSIYAHNRVLLERAQMEQVAISRANKVTTELTRLLYKTQVLSATVIKNNGEIIDFEQMAATILDDPSIKNLILAPKGIVQYVYPIIGNEEVLGLDYFSEGDGNLEAIQAKSSGQLVLGGPFHLIQGGYALVGRLPVYLEDNNFWGIASVTLNYPDALAQAELDQLASQGYAFEIWRISPETQQKQVIASNDYEQKQDAPFVEYPMNILNAQWYFKLSPIRVWYEFPETWLFIFAGILISMLLALFMVHNHDLSLMKNKLEELSLKDPLTGVLNRRALYQAMNRLDNGTPYLLYYIDLNNFKKVNDYYGHSVGDTLLQRFTFIFQQNLDERNHIFARIGGDEFILIFKNTDNIEAAELWFSQIQETLTSTPIFYENQKLSVSFSAGFAVYPAEGKTVDTLLKVADERMYANKNISKETLERD